MEIYLNEIKEKLQQLIDGKMSREFIAEWAKERQIAEDNDQLEYVPFEGHCCRNACFASSDHIPLPSAA